MDETAGWGLGPVMKVKGVLFILLYFGFIIRQYDRHSQNLPGFRGCALFLSGYFLLKPFSCNGAVVSRTSKDCT